MFNLFSPGAESELDLGVVPLPTDWPDMRVDNSAVEIVTRVTQPAMDFAPVLAFLLAILGAIAVLVVLFPEEERHRPNRDLPAARHEGEQLAIEPELEPSRAPFVVRTIQDKLPGVGEFVADIQEPPAIAGQPVPGSRARGATRVRLAATCSRGGSPFP